MLSASSVIVNSVTYPILRKLVSQVLSGFFNSGLVAKLLAFANILECKGGNINHSVGLGNDVRTDTERHSIATHDRLIKSMINHIEEPLFVSRIARQTDLLGATLWCLSLGKIDICEVGPIN